MRVSAQAETSAVVSHPSAVQLPVVVHTKLEQVEAAVAEAQLPEHSPVAAAQPRQRALLPVPALPLAEPLLLPAHPRCRQSRRRFRPLCR
jgi:hypothetical protein